MRYLLKIRYDGSKLNGFATQPNKNTVEDNLNLVLQDIFKEDIKIVGCSRTDAKVHAYGQMVHFDADRIIIPSKVKKAMNSKLREDISCYDVQVVDDKFHARFCVKSKTYRYRVMSQLDPQLRTTASFFRYKLDIDAVKTAAKFLVGTHDFTSFCTKSTRVVDKVRTIHYLKVIEEQDMVVFEINGDGFLYNMIRIIMGTLMQVGRGQIDPLKIPEIIELKHRKYAGFTAAPEGLCLMDVQY